jgi:hypothetical protein
MDQNFYDTPHNRLWLAQLYLDDLYRHAFYKQ